MDKQKASEILNGGTTNALEQSGTMITDPHIVVQLLFDGEEYSMQYGSFRIADDLLDYAVHRAKQVTLGEQDAYYETNLVEADLYTLDDDGTVEVNRFEATPDGWIETDR